MAGVRAGISIYEKLLDAADGKKAEGHKSL
jgi:hypothetical protein